MFLKNNIIYILLVKYIRFLIELKYIEFKYFLKK